jgi:hypothetical protein
LASQVATVREPGRWVPALWLVTFALLGGVIALVYVDAGYQDAGYHFLRARWAWTHMWMLVDVWGRPGFTLLYSLPARLGYPAARLFTVAICTAMAWQTWRLAQDLEIPRAWLAIPLVWLLPVVLDISGQTMTEPLFALVFVIALRLHVSGRLLAGALVASISVLVRPEGWFLVALWAIWLVRDRRTWGSWYRRFLLTAALGTGALVWWITALQITADPLFIIHNWPANWSARHTIIDLGPLLAYNHKWRAIFNPFLEPAFAVGLIALLATRRFGVLTSSFFLVLLIHGIFQVGGGAETLSEPRYFVCVAPAIALITLTGWNLIARLTARVPRAGRVALGTGVLGAATIAAVLYVDSSIYPRDGWMVRREWAWLSVRRLPIPRLIWSETYMCIVADCDPEARQVPQNAPDAALAALAAAPPGTIVFWDDDAGPSFFGVTGSQIMAQGYTLLRTHVDTMPGLLSKWWPGGTLPVRLRWWQPPLRTERVWLMYKDASPSAAGPRPPAAPGAASS